MIIYKHSEDLQSYLGEIKKNRQTIGFVPTMGALHEGHLSLIKKCRQNSDITISSIFVNPAQFNNAEDFNKYPSNIENDILLLEQNGCDVLFTPSEEEIYPDEASKSANYDLGYLEKILEGKFRPGHFQGVCLVVEKLLNITNPNFLFLGQKDYQQFLVIKKLIHIMGKEIKIILCPILREPNGLAMSSRNLRLTATEINTAAYLYGQLEMIKKNVKPGNFTGLKNDAIDQLKNAGFSVDYLEMAKSKNLEIIEDVNCENKEEYIILIAAFLNKIRLIDNILVANPC
ncbi:MAG: pantoate--beta-alanine ligase [Bacteroidota bacterium]|nr:pantoate--beta-alanine ligase [Bacteroidota bacterium]